MDRNPAHASPLLTRLFGTGFATAELRIAGDPQLLPAAEREALPNAVLKRRQEFAAGRLCARRALAQLGVSDYSLRIGEDRQPQWPQHIAGSITHAPGFCAAVVVERSRILGVGVDAEVLGRVTPELWPQICVPEEADWLAGLPEHQQAPAATLLFSAKEAFYKCQSGITGQWLEFQDVALDLQTCNLSAGVFVIRPVARLALHAQVAMPWRGSFAIDGAIVVTAIAMGDARTG